MLPLGTGLGPEGSPGAQLAYRRGSCSTHWKSLCEAWRPIQRSKVTLGRLAVMNACSKGFAMVTSWASCCSQENCASDHFTWSWGSWPWIRKHWGRRGRHDVQFHLPVPQTQKLHCVPLSSRPWGGFGGCEKNIRTRTSGSRRASLQYPLNLPQQITYTCPHSGEFLVGGLLWATKGSTTYDNGTWAKH